MKAKKLAIIFACILMLSLLPAALAASNTTSTTDTKSDATATDSSKATAGKDAGKDKAAEEYAGPSDELLAWAEDRPCTACHTNEAASADNEKCGMYVHSLLEVACITCHADDALIDVHANAKANAKVPTKLKKSKLTVEGCTTCHTSEALIQAGAEKALW